VSTQPGDLAERARTEDPASTGTLKTAARCLEMMRVIANARESLSLDDIAKTMELHPSTARALVTTLVKSGFVERRADRRYYTGFEAFVIGCRFIHWSAICRNAFPVLMRLAEESNAHTNLGFWHRGKVVVVEWIGKPGRYDVFHHPGTVLPAHATALGKCLLAFQGEEALEEIGPLDRFTENTITDIAKLKEQLGEILRRGYAIDDQEQIPGIRCVAGPILPQSGKPEAAISISTSVREVNPSTDAERGAKLMEAMRSLSVQLGYQDYGFDAAIVRQQNSRP
jgi:IclR family transcriptional regulator, acetate operon repressor